MEKEPLSKDLLVCEHCRCSSNSFDQHKGDFVNHLDKQSIPEDSLRIKDVGQRRNVSSMLNIEKDDTAIAMSNIEAESSNNPSIDLNGAIIRNRGIKLEPDDGRNGTKSSAEPVAKNKTYDSSLQLDNERNNADKITSDNASNTVTRSGDSTNIYVPFRLNENSSLSSGSYMETVTVEAFLSNVQHESNFTRNYKNLLAADKIQCHKCEQQFTCMCKFHSHLHKCSLWKSYIVNERNCTAYPLSPDELDMCLRSLEIEETGRLVADNDDDNDMNIESTGKSDHFDSYHDYCKSKSMHGNDISDEPTITPGDLIEEEVVVKKEKRDNSDTDEYYDGDEDINVMKINHSPSKRSISEDRKRINFEKVKKLKSTLEKKLERPTSKSIGKGKKADPAQSKLGKTEVCVSSIGNKRIACIGDTTETNTECKQAHLGKDLRKNDETDNTIKKRKRGRPPGKATKAYKSEYRSLRKCKWCKEKFLRQEIDLHQKNDHKELYEKARPFCCGVCDARFISEGQRMKHEIAKHGDESEYNALVECSLCHAQVKKWLHLNHLEESHTKLQMPFQCPHCEKRFGERRYYDRHIREHSTEFHCDQCGKVFRQKESLKKHIMWLHSMERPFKCNICGAGFVKASLRKRHISKHTGVRDFQCDICGMTFKRRENVRFHVQAVHQKQRKFSCSMCDQSFCTNYQLKCHTLKKHSNVRPYQCSVCPNEFIERKELRRHLKQQHNLLLDMKTTPDLTHVLGGDTLQPGQVVLEFEPRVEALTYIDEHQPFHDSKLVGSKSRTTKTTSDHVTTLGSQNSIMISDAVSMCFTRETDNISSDIKTESADLQTGMVVPDVEEIGLSGNYST